jgi:NAD dependent epimerase/dehydratase family enzyme
MPFMTGVPNPHGEVAYSKLTRPEQLAYMREKNRKAYLKKVGKLKKQSPLNSDPAITKAKKALAVSEWQKRNPEKVVASRIRQKLSGNDKAKAARRRARKKRACPAWVCHVELKNIYKKCPNGYHVDHIVPLAGKNVSGLHVPWNLQYLPATENIRKGNKCLL